MKYLLPFIALLLLVTTGLVAQDDSCPCCAEHFTAFDFWIGEWEVFRPDGTPAGTNEIRKEQDGCVLRENWASSNQTFTGTSTSFYNGQTKQWEQVWVDNAGSNLYLKGNRSGNQMILRSDPIPRENNPPYVNQITWTLNDDGTVRQLWEILIEDEVSSVAFDGLYRKKS